MRGLSRRRIFFFPCTIRRLQTTFEIRDGHWTEWAWMHVTGAFLIVLGGMMEGLFALPVRLTPRWSWENIWGAGSLAALLLVPAPLLWLTIPRYWEVYAATPGWTIVSTVIFGAGWG